MKTHKRCAACFEMRPIAEFQIHGKSLDKHVRVCDTCFSKGIDENRTGGNRVCSRCENIKPYTEFSVSRGQCKECRNQINKEYHRQPHVKKRHQKYYQERHMKYATYRINYSAKNRHGITDKVSIEDVKELVAESGGKCCYCGGRLNFTRKFGQKTFFAVDHVVPLSRGGKHHKSNLAICCWQCNVLKRDFMVDEFREIIGRIFRHFVEVA